MRLLGYLCVLGLALCSIPAASHAEDVEAYLKGYDDASMIAMATSCDKKLNDSGTGSTCSCSASGSGANCICSGSGNQRVCSCSDGTDKTYCYFCSGGSGCECGATNRSGQKCATVSMTTLSGIEGLAVK